MNCTEKMNGKDCPNPVNEGDTKCVYHKNQKTKKVKDFFIKAGLVIIGFVVGLAGDRAVTAVFSKFSSKKK